MNLGNLKDIKLQNLREHSPETYRELQQSGNLDEYLESKATAAEQELDSLIDAGYSDQEAWEVVREDFLMPVDDESDEDEGPNDAMLSLLNETIDIQNRALEELAEVPPQSEQEPEN